MINGINVIEIIAIVFGSGGIIAAIVAFIKVQPETSRVIIDSAEGAVVVQSGVITDLRNEIARLAESCRGLQTQLDTERRECSEKLAAQDVKIDAQELEINDLREAVRSIGSRKADHPQP